LNFNVCYEINCQDLLSLSSTFFKVGFSLSGYNIINASQNNLQIGELSGGNYPIKHLGSTETAYIQSNSLSYLEVVSTPYNNAAETLKAATTIGKTAYTGDTAQNKVNFICPPNYWGTAGVYSAGFHWFKGGVSGDPTVTRVTSFATAANRQMWLTPESSLILSSTTGITYTANVDSFQMYSNDIVAGNAAPHFRTENGNIIKLYQETTAVAAATFVVGVGTAVTDASTFDGYTLKQVVKALRNMGILA
jgi:hypothetical protein